jgi:hypothetical protein
MPPLKEASRLGDPAYEWLSRDRARALLLRGAALGDAERWKDRRPAKAPAPAQEVLDLILLPSSRTVSINRPCDFGEAEYPALPQITNDEATEGSVAPPPPSRRPVATPYRDHQP